MIAGPEVAKVVEEFHKELDHCSCKTNTPHHDQTPKVQTTFGKDVSSLISVKEDLAILSNKKVLMFFTSIVKRLQIM